MTKYLFVFSTALLISSVSFAQKPIEILVTLENHPYPEIFITKVSNDSITVTSFEKEYYIAIEEIKYLRIEKKGHVMLGMLGGVLIGGYLGTLVPEDKDSFFDLTKTFTPIIFAGVGGLIGGLFTQGYERTYNFEKMNKNEKYELLKDFL